MQNFAKKQMEDISRFKNREFVIYDEAHKILDIIQDNYSPCINKEIFKMIESYEDSINNSNILNKQISFKDDIFVIFKDLRINSDKVITLENLKNIIITIIRYKGNEFKNIRMGIRTS